jgi:hypothetical protein
MRSRNKLGEAADRRTARACDKVRECGAALQKATGRFWARVTLPGSQLRLSCAGIGTQTAVELPMVLPIRILQLSPAAQQLIDNN